MSRHGLCSSTPRGDGNLDLNKSSRSRHYDRFMQLNPARGRKLVIKALIIFSITVGVYAAQPREGTETLRIFENLRATLPRFMQLNPARGRKPVCLSLCLAVCLSRFMQLNPARGRKPAHGVVHGPGNRKGLCSSTPRGDGNYARIRITMNHDLSTRFMQLNPARGRKLRQ